MLGRIDGRIGRIKVAAVWTLFVGGIFGCLSVAGPHADDGVATKTTAAVLSYVDPLRVEGEQKCVDCHKSEYREWQKSHHATATFDMLRAGPYAKQSREFAKKLEIPLNDVARTSVCVSCHATPQIVDGREKVLPSVSCEACHGVSGGEEGWLNAHAVYGPTGTQRAAETLEHQQSRVGRCQQAGQNGVERTFSLAVACYRCHLVWDEKLVNVAEHPSGSEKFRFVNWSLGEVRHNYHMNQSRNELVSTLWASPVWKKRDATLLNRKRLMFVSGKLALLYVALENRSLATEEGDFLDDMESYTEDAADELRDIVIAFSEEDEDEDKEYDPDDLPPVQAAVEAFDRAMEAIEKLTEELDDNEKLSDEERLKILFARTSELYSNAAQLAKEAGVQFENTHDGSLLEVVDDDLPVINADPADEDNEAHFSDYWKSKNLRKVP